MWEEILSALFFFAPAGFANLSPILAAHLPLIEKWNTPVDLGKTYKGKRIFGDNKTYRGLVAGFVVAYGFLAYQVYLVETGGWSSDLVWLNYSELNIFWAALAFSLGALGGDMIKSFFKRQMQIDAGKSWFPFDQIDYIVGGLLATSWFADISLENVLVTLIVWFILHPIATTVGWLFGLKKTPI